MKTRDKTVDQLVYELATAGRPGMAALLVSTMAMIDAPALVTDQGVGLLAKSLGLLAKSLTEAGMARADAVVAALEKTGAAS